MATKTTKLYTVPTGKSDPGQGPRPQVNEEHRHGAAAAKQADTGRTSNDRGPLAGGAVENGSIYESIREGILAGRYAPGERLIETRLADEFGVSRTRIRDALARLHADHMVAPAPNRGLVVRPLYSRDIEEIYALRLLLEGYAVNAAAANITTRELDELHLLHNRMLDLEQTVSTDRSDEERLAEIRMVTDLNNEIHRGIQRASRNRRLESLLRAIVSVPLVFQSFYWYSDRELAESSREHAEILTALKERDGALAESLMRRHITRGFNTILRELPNF